MHDDVLRRIWGIYFSSHVLPEIPRVGDWGSFPSWWFSENDKRKLSLLYDSLTTLNVWEDVVEMDIMNDEETERMLLSGLMDDRNVHLRGEFSKIARKGWHAYVKDARLAQRDVRDKLVKAVCSLLLCSPCAVVFSCSSSCSFYR